MSQPHYPDAEPYHGWNPTRREARENRVNLNPCEPCAHQGRKRSSKFAFREVNGDFVDVCCFHWLKLTDEIRTEEMAEME